MFPRNIPHAGGGWKKPSPGCEDLKRGIIPHAGGGWKKKLDGNQLQTNSNIPHAGGGGVTDVSSDLIPEIFDLSKIPDILYHYTTIQEF